MQSTAQSPSNIENSQDKAQHMVVSIICAVAFAHLLNDLIQASLPAIYPLLKTNFSLSFEYINTYSTLAGNCFETVLPLLFFFHTN